MLFRSVFLNNPKLMCDVCLATIDSILSHDGDRHQQHIMRIVDNMNRSGITIDERICCTIIFKANDLPVEYKLNLFMNAVGHQIAEQQNADSTICAAVCPIPAVARQSSIVSGPVISHLIVDCVKHSKYHYIDELYNFVMQTKLIAEPGVANKFIEGYGSFDLGKAHSLFLSLPQEIKYSGPAIMSMMINFIKHKRHASWLEIASDVLLLFEAQNNVWPLPFIVTESDRRNFLIMSRNVYSYMNKLSRDANDKKMMRMAHQWKQLETQQLQLYKDSAAQQKQQRQQQQSHSRSQPRKKYNDIPA